MDIGHTYDHFVKALPILVAGYLNSASSLRELEPVLIHPAPSGGFELDAPPDPEVLGLLTVAEAVFFIRGGVLPHPSGSIFRSEVCLDGDERSPVSLLLAVVVDPAARKSAVVEYRVVERAGKLQQEKATTYSVEQLRELEDEVDPDEVAAKLDADAAAHEGRLTAGGGSTAPGANRSTDAQSIGVTPALPQDPMSGPVPAPANAAPTPPPPPVEKSEPDVLIGDDGDPEPSEGIDSNSGSANAAKREHPAEEASATKVCPDCAETIRIEAKVCRFCSFRFEPSPTETRRRYDQAKVTTAPIAKNAAIKTEEALVNQVGGRVGGIGDAMDVDVDHSDKKAFGRKEKELRKWLKKQKASLLTHKGMIGLMAQLARTEAVPLLASEAVMFKSPMETNKRELNAGVLISTDKELLYLRNRPGALTHVGLTNVVKMIVITNENIEGAGAAATWFRGALVVRTTEGQTYLWGGLKPKSAGVEFAAALRELAGARVIDFDVEIKPGLEGKGAP